MTFQSVEKGDLNSGNFNVDRLKMAFRSVKNGDLDSGNFNVGGLKNDFPKRQE